LAGVDGDGGEGAMKYGEMSSLASRIDRERRTEGARIVSARSALSVCSEVRFLEPADEAEVGGEPSRARGMRT
jgi:hypothetical protein